MKALDRNLWQKETHSKNEKSIWLCPKCEKGALSLSEEDIVDVNSAYTNSIVDHEDFDYEWIKNYYSAVFKCTNDNCEESVVGSGNLTFRHCYDYDQKGRMHEWVDAIFSPSFFVPSLRLFGIPIIVNEEIKSQIQKSFSHFFNDTSAAANSIRTSLELILNDQKVKKSRINNSNKRVQLSLHNRIEIFGNQNNELKPFLIAAKWIGNAGSHMSNVTKEDLLDGYELLEHCLNELYDKPRRLKELESKAKSINTRKKPRSTEKKK